MAWVRLDDQFVHHPKFSSLDGDAFCLWVAGVCYCRRYLTDGLISTTALSTIAPQIRRPALIARTLVQAGLWHPTDGGFQVHDFLDWNPSRAQDAARKEQDRSRKQKIPPPDSERNPKGIRKDSRVWVRSSSSGESAREPSALEDRFGRWWAAYPRKVGRQAAWREWQRIDPSEDRLVEMLGVLTLQRQSHDWVKEQGRFVPHPKTYLHQGRWEDLVPALQEPEPVWERWDECAACGDVHAVGKPCPVKKDAA